MDLYNIYDICFCLLSYNIKFWSFIPVVACFMYQYFIPFHHWILLYGYTRQEDFSITWGKVSFSFYPGLQLIEWGPPTLGREIFTQSTDLNVNLIQKKKCLYRNTENNLWPNICTLCGSVMLTHEINNYSMF